jgi:hypothetical protein
MDNRALIQEAVIMGKIRILSEIVPGKLARVNTVLYLGLRIEDTLRKQRSPTVKLSYLFRKILQQVSLLQLVSLRSAGSEKRI